MDTRFRSAPHLGTLPNSISPAKRCVMTSSDKPQKILAGLLITAFVGVGIFGIWLLVQRVDHYRLQESLPRPLHADTRNATMIQIAVLGAGLGLWLFVLIVSLRRYVAWCRQGPVQGA
jgi:hypothetical protein